MSIMVGIPVIYCAECVRSCLRCLKNQKAEIFIIDNNSDSEIKEIIKPYKKIVNPKNVYVNPAWDQIIEEFLKSDHDLLVIMNSDLYIKHDVIQKLSDLDLDGQKTIACLNIVTNFSECERVVTCVDSRVFPVPGVFIPLTRKMAREVYPIHQDIKIYFGDNWIYDKLQNMGYTVRFFSDMQATHGLSKSVDALPEAQEVIKQDVLAWHSHVKQLLGRANDSL